MANCNCEFCVLGEKIEDTIASKDVDRLISLVRELQNELLYTSDDLDHLKVIMDGSWPSAVEQLEKALEKAKNHPNRDVSTPF